jgi:hypothetical protein
VPFLRSTGVCADQGGQARMSVLHPGYFTPTDIWRLQRWEELVSEAVVVLEGNVEVLSSLRQFYLHLLQCQDFPQQQSCADEIREFANQVETMMNDCRINIARAKALVKTTTDRKELVRLESAPSSCLQTLTSRRSFSIVGASQLKEWKA